MNKVWILTAVTPGGQVEAETRSSYEGIINAEQAARECGAIRTYIYEMSARDGLLHIGGYDKRMEEAGNLDSDDTSAGFDDITRKRIHQLLDIVLDINGCESRQQTYTGTKPTAFFEYAGHINSLLININPAGWHKEAKTADNVSVLFDLDKDLTHDDVVSAFCTCINAIKEARKQ